MWPFPDWRKGYGRKSALSYPSADGNSPSSSVYPRGDHTVASLKSFFGTQSVSIGTATIYRQMEKLIEDGLVRKYTLEGEESACYEYVGTSCSQAVPHFHCKCEKCGQLIHLSCDELSSIRKHLLEHHGFLRQNNVFRHLSEMPGIVSVLK